MSKRIIPGFHDDVGIQEEKNNQEKKEERRIALLLTFTPSLIKNCAHNVRSFWAEVTVAGRALQTQPHVHDVARSTSDDEIQSSS